MRYAGALVALAGLWLAMLLLGGGPLDRAIYEALYAGHRPTLASLAGLLTFFGEPTLLVSAGFLVAAWLWWRGHRHLPLALLLIVLVGRGISEVQKYVIARVRPDLEPHLVAVQTSSFPSGHATSSVIFGLTVALGLAAGTRWERAAVAVAILLALLIEGCARSARRRPASGLRSAGSSLSRSIPKFILMYESVCAMTND